MRKKSKPFEVGDILIKTNHMPFGSKNKVITITVKSIKGSCKSGCFLVNDIYIISYNSVIKISEEEKIKIEHEWNSIAISEYNNTENDPCISSISGLPKQIVVESQIKELVYYYRHKYNNSAFEVYKCPKCGNLHLGKNKLKLENVC